MQPAPTPTTVARTLLRLFLSILIAILNVAWLLITLIFDLLSCLFARGLPGAPVGKEKDRTDGMSILTFLSTFGIIQVASLLTLVRDRESAVEIVVTVYMFAGFLTVAGISYVINARIETLDNGALSAAPLYNTSTIRTGRMLLLFWFLIVFLISVLGYKRALPGMPSPREDWDPKVDPIDCFVHDSKNMKNVFDTLYDGGSVPQYAITTIAYLRRISGSLTSEQLPEGKIQDCYFLIQKSPFQRRLKTFYVRINKEPGTDIDASYAFLFRNDSKPPSFQPVLRQQIFRFDDEGGNTDVLGIRDANPDDRLIVILLLRTSAGKQLPQDGEEKKLNLLFVAHDDS